MTAARSLHERVAMGSGMTHPEVRLGNSGLDDGQAELPLATEGVVRYIWYSRFGAVLIEAREGTVYVNGEPVQPASGNYSGNG